MGEEDVSNCNVNGLECGGYGYWGDQRGGSCSNQVRESWARILAVWRERKASILGRLSSRDC